MKYKVGDEVRIKSLDWYNENKDNYGVIYAGNGFCFWEYMVRHCGEIMKIAIVKVDPEDSNKGYYFMETSEEKWTDEMIEGLVEEATEPKFKVGDRVKWYNYTCNITSIDTNENTYTYLIKHDDYREDKIFAKWVPESELTFEDDVETKPEPKFKVGDRVFNLATKKSVNIIEWDEETGLYIVRYDDGVQGRSLESELKRLEHITLDDVKDETKPKAMGEVSDGYHTFNELYEYRLLYNASMFNELAKQNLYDVHKSKRHSDGEVPFGDSNWFIVMAELPTGQISNHYEMKDWDLFDIPEKEIANEWDGHTPKDVAERLRRFLTPKPKYPKTYEECCKVLDFCGEYFFTTYEEGIHLPENNNVVKIHQILKSTSILTKLIICRDVYWKIAGDEMGLVKPWEPDWNSLEPKYTISVSKNSVKLIWEQYYHRVFAFPTEEMRDAFYENFKKEIEICKELL